MRGLRLIFVFAVATGCGADESNDQLVRVDDEPPGDNCPAGGVAIHTGSDDNGNQELDDDEIASTSYACSGQDGTDGEDGQDGAGSATLIQTTPELAGANCTAGGTRIDSGPDQDGDGELDAEEVAATSYLCNGEPGAATLVRVDEEPPGDNCPTGGSAVRAGADDDDSGTLGDAEIDSTAYLCNGSDGTTTLIRLDEESPGANCAYGGTAVQSGPDVNDDGELGDDEIAATAYVCNGSDSLVLVFDQLLLSGDDTAREAGQYLDADESTLVSGTTNVTTDGTSGALFVWSRGPDGNWSEAVKLTPPSGLGNISFADGSVSISEGTAVAGARNEQVGGQYVGAAYVFTRDETGAWARTQRLAPSDGPNGGFGTSVSVDGAYMAVGVPSRGANRGEVHVFRMDDLSGQWLEEQQLSALDAQDGDLLGHVVAISGTTILASAFGDDDAGTDLGSVYVFDRNPNTGVWSQSQKLVPPIASQASIIAPFGRYLSIDGNYCAIAAPGDSEYASSAGAVFIYERRLSSGWSQRAKLVPIDVVANTYFGSEISLVGDVLVAGVGADHDLGLNSGSAYVFRRNPATGDWLEHQKIHAPDGVAGDQFGHGVAISTAEVLLGSPGKDVDGISGYGAVYTFAPQ